MHISRCNATGIDHENCGQLLKWRGVLPACLPKMRNSWRPPSAWHLWLEAALSRYTVPLWPSKIGRECSSLTTFVENEWLVKLKTVHPWAPILILLNTTRHSSAQGSPCILTSLYRAARVSARPLARTASRHGAHFTGTLLVIFNHPVPEPLWQACLWSALRLLFKP